MKQFPIGVNEVLDRVEGMTLDQLLKHIDLLEGRTNLVDQDCLEEVRRQARHQTWRDWELPKTGFWGEIFAELDCLKSP